MSEGQRGIFESKTQQIPFSKIYLSSVFFLLIFLGNSFESKAQTQAINLESILKLGGSNNLTIQAYLQQQELALADLTKAREWWLPDIYAGFQIHQLWGSAMNGDGRFFTDVNRQNFWGGIGLNASWDFGNAIFKQDALELKAEALAFQSQANRNKILLEIIQVYYDFLANQLYFKAYEQLANQADTIARQIAIQVEAGLRFESEVLLAKSNLNHLKIEMLNAKMNYAKSSAKLIQLLNLPPETILFASDSILAPLNLIQANNLHNAFETAYQNRPELKSMDLVLQSIKTERKTTTTGLLLPQVNFGTYGSTFGDVFSPSYPTSEINAAVVWRIPLGRLAYKGSLKQYDSRIVLQENQIAQTIANINEEILASKAEISLAKEQLKLASEGNELSKKALKQSLDRQKLGTVRPFEILQAQEIYIKSRLDYLQAVASFNKAQYAYFVARGNNL